MSTTIKTGWLQDNNGEKIAPRTLSSQVQTNDGMLLEDKLAEIYVNKEEIIDVEHGGTGANNASDARANIGAAPAGFGLGNTGVYLDDFNAMVWSGFYYTDANTKNRMQFCPDLGAVLVVNGNKVGRQYKLLLGKNYEVGLLCIYYTNDYGSTWTVEWINPPMVDGVEYRTTERFLGQPVYTILRRIGGFTGNGTCTLGSTGYHAVVRVCATASYGGVLLKVDDSKVKTIQHSTGYVYVQVSMGSETCTDCYVQMWYTK